MKNFKQKVVKVVDERCANLFKVYENILTWEFIPRSVDDRNAFGDMPLHTACRWGEIESVKVLVENGADVNALGEFGHTPLFSACGSGSFEMVEFLLKQGANPRVKNEWGTSLSEFVRLIRAKPKLIALIDRKAGIKTEKHNKQKKKSNTRLPNKKKR